MDTRIFLITFSPKLEDGSRKTLKEEVIATCKDNGQAQLITYLLRNQDSYKKLLSIDSDNTNIYALTCERRKPVKYMI